MPCRWRTSSPTRAPRRAHPHQRRRHVSCQRHLPDGAQTIRGAVVDPAGRVRGIEGLRVADASVMPTVPRANTNIPTIMIAEKLAAAMQPA